MASTFSRLRWRPRLVAAALFALLPASSLFQGCQSTPPQGAPVPGAPSDRSAIQPVEPRPGSSEVSRIPTFAWVIPGHKNRVDTQIFNLYRADSVEGDADFIRVFDGPIERFALNEGQEEMPALGLGRLAPDTEYVWKLSLFYIDSDEIQTGEWHFRTGKE